MIGVIYKYTSPSNKIYIGQTIKPSERYRKHINEAYNAKHSGYNTHLSKAIRKYGIENFKYEIIVTVNIDNLQELTKKLDWFEQFYIRKYNSYKNGYNLTKGGGGCRGYKMSETNIKLLRERYKNSGLSKYAHKKGDVVSEETRKKISNTMKGKPKTIEHKTKVAEANAKYKKPIFCVENNTIYASVYDAAKELNLQFGNIWSVCNGRRKTTGGYHFKYNAA